MRVVSFVIAAAVLLCAGAPACTAATLVANFTANVTMGPAPLAVAFVDTSTGDPATFTWRFAGTYDEGSASWGFPAVQSFERNATYVYASPGVYAVMHEVGDPAGGSTEYLYNLTVLAPVAGDYNGNGRCDFADVTGFFAALETTPYRAELDLNANGRMDFGDVVAIFARL